MRIRPFFWCLLLFSCLGILVFATIDQPYAPAKLQVHVAQQHGASTNVAILELYLTDPEGIPIDTAQVLSHARMTNMNMSTQANHIQVQGHGKYMVQLHLAMTGPWAITIQANSNGFLPLQQTLLVDIQ